MSTTTPNAFGPYGSPGELARGKRKAMVSLAVAVAADYVRAWRMLLDDAHDRALGTPVD